MPVVQSRDLQRFEVGDKVADLTRVQDWFEWRHILASIQDQILQRDVVYLATHREFTS